MATLNIHNIKLEVTLQEDQQNSDIYEYQINFKQGDKVQQTTIQKLSEQNIINFEEQLDLSICSSQDKFQIELLKRKDGEQNLEKILDQEVNLDQLKQNENQDQSLQQKQTIDNNEYNITYTAKIQNSEQQQQQQNQENQPQDQQQQEQDQNQVQQDQNKQPQNNQQQENTNTNNTNPQSMKNSKHNQSHQHQQSQQSQQQENSKQSTSAYKFTLEGLRAYLNNDQDKVLYNYELYCSIIVGTQKQESQPVTECANRPEWNQMFKFQVEQEKQIEIIIHERILDPDQQQNQEKIIGRSVFYLEQYQKHTPQFFKSQKSEIIIEGAHTKQTCGNVYFDLHSYPPHNQNTSPSHYQERKKQQKRNNNNTQNNSKQNPNNKSQDIDHDDTYQDSLYATQESRNVQKSMLNQSVCSQIYGYGTSEFHSASSLQHSIPSISFSKQKRWNPKSQSQVNTTRSVGMIKLPSIFESKQVNGSYLQKGPFIGYGKKQMNHPYQDINAVQNPSPQDYYPEHYELKKSFTARAVTGKEYCTFGCSREDNSKLHMPNSKLVNPKLLKGIPGPNQYQQYNENFAKDKSAYTIPHKPKPVLNDPYYTPSPLHYTPVAQKQGRKTGCANFGYGARGQKPKEITPGPANYVIPSKFDQIGKQNRYSLSQKRLETINY